MSDEKYDFMSFEGEVKIFIGNKEMEGKSRSFSVVDS